jgi:hypothetical protein
MKPSRAALSYGETLNGGGLSVATHFVSGAFADRVRHLMGEIPRRPEKRPTIVSRGFMRAST